MSTSTVPSAAGATSNVYDAPPPAKLSTLLLEAAPERTMSGAANPVTASPNSTVKLSASALVGLDCAAVIAGTGSLLSCVIENRAAARLGLPTASRAAPAGMSTSTVPSAAGATSNVYDAPPPAKLSTLLLEAAPERTMSGAANPVTASPNSTVKLSASALVGLDCAAVIAGTGSLLSCVIENRAAALPFPAASRAVPVRMSTCIVPSDVGETSKEYEAPPPAKLAAPTCEAVPERTTSGAANPVTGSPNSTAKLIVKALVGLDCVAVTVGVGAVLSG